TFLAVARTAAPSCVLLIQGASRAVVLSDIWTAAAGRAGKLREAFARPDADDRDPSGAMRPALILAGRKFFVAAQLFTVDCGELFLRALLATG
ncbi:MAG TPA: hypothetical protein VGO67_03295, partial [Verrucomicrobiae bacterium]